MLAQASARLEAAFDLVDGPAGRFFCIDLIRHGADAAYVFVGASADAEPEDAINAYFQAIAGFGADEVAFAMETRYVEDDNPDTGQPWRPDEIRVLDLNGPDGADMPTALSLFLVTRRGRVRHYMRPFEIDDDTHALRWGDAYLNAHPQR